MPTTVVARVLLVVLWLAVSVPAAACTGDCDGTGTITIQELVRGVNLALGAASVEECPRFDANRDRRVSIDELVAAVGAALSSCVVAIPNVLVNDRSDQPCGSGCVQSETSIALLGPNIVIGYNDTEGRTDRTQGLSSYSYSTDGGMTWIDGGGLPLRGPDDSSLGDPSVVACGDAVYYGSLYQGPQCATEVTVLESEPNDVATDADLVGLGDNYVGALDSADDVDVIRFDAPANTVVAAAIASPAAGPRDKLLELRSGDGMELLAVGAEGLLLHTIETDGSYSLVVRAAGQLSQEAYTVLLRGCPGAGVAALRGISVSRGTFVDGELVWELPVATPIDVETSPGFLDKDYLACDEETGALYVAYTNFLLRDQALQGQIELVRSTDRGQSWSLPTVVAPYDPTLCRHPAYPAVGPGGEVYVLFEQSTQLCNITPRGRPAFRLRKSVDGGATFPLDTEVATFSESTFRGIAGYNRGHENLPAIAVDRSDGPHRGAVYVVFVDAAGEGLDVMLARSADGGASFEPPVRINDDPPGADHFFPWVTVDSSDGTVSVIWYDRRFDAPTEAFPIGWTDVYLAQSTDGGVTWSPNRLITDTPSRWVSVESDGSPNFGDYINAVAADGVLYAAWADARFGNPDVFFARVSPLAR